MRRLAAAAVAVVLAACSGGGGDGPSPADRSTEPTDRVILDTTTTTAEVPLTGVPLVVAEQGVSSFPDPFDPASTLGGYGVILENPNPDVLAAGVRVTTRILGPDGAELLVDRTLLNAVMPGARMALGRTLIEPVADPTSLEVTVEVSAWLRPAYPEGSITAEGVVTEPEANGGAVTRFIVRSTWPAMEEGVDATAIYRGADGQLLAAESTTLPAVSPGVEATAQIRLLSPIPGVTSTEVLVGRGISAQTTG